jgi:hypothetical protein
MPPLLPLPLPPPLPPMPPMPPLLLPLHAAASPR